MFDACDILCVVVVCADTDWFDLPQTAQLEASPTSKETHNHRESEALSRGKHNTMTSLDTAQPPPDHPEDSNPEELQQRLQEMQARIAVLESELSQMRPTRIDIRLKLRALAGLFVAVSLAAIPPLLVVPIAGSIFYREM
jgi:hypothetical protein